MEELSEEKFCQMVQGYDGEPIDSIEQISLMSFDGKGLKEFVEHCMKWDNKPNEHDLLCAFFKFFRDNGEANIGMTIEQFVDAFINTLKK